MKKVSVKNVVASLFVVLDDLPQRQHAEVVSAFVRLLGRYKLLSRTDKVLAEVERVAHERAGVVSVHITSARPLTSELKRLVTKNLQADLKQEIDLREQVDEGLVGGAVIRYGDDLIDGSVRRHLQTLRKSLQD